MTSDKQFQFYICITRITDFNTKYMREGYMHFYVSTNSLHLLNCCFYWIVFQIYSRFKHSKSLLWSSPRTTIFSNCIFAVFLSYTVICLQNKYIVQLFYLTPAQMGTEQNQMRNDLVMQALRSECRCSYIQVLRLRGTGWTFWLESANM